MTEIILVRHGETEWNAAEIFRGRADIALNENGLRQAKLAGEYLKDEPVAAIYTSPLQRAVKTAEAIAAHHKLPVIASENLNDIDCGKWEGMLLTDVKQNYPETYRDWMENPEKVTIPGGESLEGVKNRAWPFIQHAAAHSKAGKIIIVSHRAVHKVLICALLRLDNGSFWSFKLDNGGITRFSFDGSRAVMTAHNDTSFLKPLKTKPLNDF